MPMVDCDLHTNQRGIDAPIKHATFKYKNDKAEKWVEIAWCPIQAMEIPDGLSGCTFLSVTRHWPSRLNIWSVCFADFKRLHTQDQYGGGTGLA